MIKNQCPGCKLATLDPVKVRNSLSRYCNLYICTGCGLREALEGDFMKKCRHDIKMDTGGGTVVCAQCSQTITNN